MKLRGLENLRGRGTRFPKTDVYKENNNAVLDDTNFFDIDFIEYIIKESALRIFEDDPGPSEGNDEESVGATARY